MVNKVDRSSFGAHTTTDEVLDGIDLNGKLALVTGGSSGLGAETARALASKGVRVVITARNMSKGEAVASDICTSTGNNDIEVQELELGSLTSVHNFAEKFLAKHNALDILINNAGVMACPFDKTEDGFEMQFGTNHLGHFLLTGLLCPALLKAAPSRIVLLSSSGHRYSPVIFEDICYEQRPYDKWNAYGQSKTANILHAVELNRRLGPQGVHAYSLNPGAIITELMRHMDEADWEMVKERMDSGALKSKTVEGGSATSVYAATAPELEGHGGVFLEDCQIASFVDNDEAEPGGIRPFAVDTESAEKLWAVSEKMVMQQF